MVCMLDVMWVGYVWCVCTCVHVYAVCVQCVEGRRWGAGPGDGGDHAKRRSAWGSGGPGLLCALAGVGAEHSEYFLLGVPCRPVAAALG